jgi:hypothetical protein
MNGATLLTASLAAPRSIISVMGDHAGEGESVIFQRKMADIERIGRTFWLVRSQKSKPELVGQLCAENQTYVIFVAPSAQGGACPTKTDKRATEYSRDRTTWNPLPAELGPVTGRLDTQSHALVFDALVTVHEARIDIWSYAHFETPANPLRMRIGCSTVCALRKNMSKHPKRMKSQYRSVVAVGRLTAPFCVWVR